MFKKLTTLLIFISMVSLAKAQEIKLYPKGFLKENLKIEEVSDSSGAHSNGASVARVVNVTEPTIKIFKSSTSSPSTKTMIVCPGGGYEILAYDLEGTEICQMLNENGFDAVLLKYRVPRRIDRAKHEAALEDVQRAVAMVRAHGDEYGICNDKVGVMGFSAGGHLSVMAATTLDKTYDRVDAADDCSSRVDFCALIYPAYLSADNFSLSEEIDVNNVSCPTFLAHAEDDKTFINSSLFYYYALKEAGKSATMHLFPEGGHGHGLRSSKAGINNWPLRMVEWMRSF